MVYVRSREDSKLLPLGLYPIAIALDYVIKPSMDVTPGAPHVAFIGTTAMGTLSNEARLPALVDHKYFLRAKEEVKLDMVMNGLPLHQDPSTFEGVKTSLLLVSWTASNRHEDDSQTDTCLETKLRAVTIWWQCVIEL